MKEIINHYMFDIVGAWFTTGFTLLKYWLAKEIWV
jgi:hypothetical protein